MTTISISHYLVNDPETNTTVAYKTDEVPASDKIRLVVPIACLADRPDLLEHFEKVGHASINNLLHQWKASGLSLEDWHAKFVVGSHVEHTDGEECGAIAQSEPKATK